MHWPRNSGLTNPGKHQKFTHSKKKSLIWWHLGFISCFEFNILCTLRPLCAFLYVIRFCIWSSESSISSSSALRCCHRTFANLSPKGTDPWFTFSFCLRAAFSQNHSPVLGHQRTAFLLATDTDAERGFCCPCLCRRQYHWVLERVRGACPLQFRSVAMRVLHFNFLGRQVAPESWPFQP